MEEQFEHDETHLNDQHTENEIKKIKLALEHGMDLSEPLTNASLPPEIEGKFLDYIQQWEDQFAKRQMILIYDLAGRPEWKPVADIADDEIAGELERLLGILKKNCVKLDTICEVKERELYRFITEELFNMETDDIRIPGIMNCFIYEEFHPNHEYDARHKCTELLEHILDKECDMQLRCLSEKVWCGENEFTKEEIRKKLTDFKDSFSSFTLLGFEYTAINMSDEKNEAEITAFIFYSGIIEGSDDTQFFTGSCSYSLSKEHDTWQIDKFEFPGAIA